MKHIIAFALVIVSAAAFAAPNVTNTVLMVDQNKNLNVEGIASVEDIATNSVKVAIAEAKAEAANDTARGVTNAIQGVVGNIMSNNVVIYRSGFSDSFAALVIYTDNDVLVVKEARWIEKSAAQIRVEVDYCCTANLGSVKPLVFHKNTLERGGSKTDFDELDDSAITTPVYHSGEVVVSGQTFSGYYTIQATIANPTGTSSYFLWLKLSGDVPGGDGTTLDLTNGVKDGNTGNYVWGDKLMIFKGGVLKEARDAN